MTKREIQKQNTKKVIELIENQYKGTVEDNGEGGRLDVEINGFTGQFHRRDYEVLLYDTTTLYGPNWSDTEIKNHQDAVVLENMINTDIEELLNK